jgi:hypothetical protein
MMRLLFEATGEGMVVDSLNAGPSHVDDLSDDDVDTMPKRGFKATTKPSALVTPRR